MQNQGFKIKKLKVLLSYWLHHNKEHMADEEKWLKETESAGFMELFKELKKIVELEELKNKQIQLTIKELERIQRKSKTKMKEKKENKKEEFLSFKFKKIGIIHTPYTNNAPYQPVENDEGNFFISLDYDYLDGLKKLSKFHYIYLIYYIHKLKREVSMTVYPPWAKGKEVGLFASRSPLRPNPIGLSVVKIKKISKNKIFTSGLDVFDGTPLLDIKPYLKDLDSKTDANYGWVDELGDKDHLILHIKGIPHEY